MPRFDWSESGEYGEDYPTFERIVHSGKLAPTRMDSKRIKRDFHAERELKVMLREVEEDE